MGIDVTPDRSPCPSHTALAGLAGPLDRAAVQRAFRHGHPVRHQGLRRRHPDRLHLRLGRAGIHYAHCRGVGDGPVGSSYTKSSCSRSSSPRWREPRRPFRRRPGLKCEAALPKPVSQALSLPSILRCRRPAAWPWRGWGRAIPRSFGAGGACHNRRRRPQHSGRACRTNLDWAHFGFYAIGAPTVARPHPQRHQFLAGARRGRLPRPRRHGALLAFRPSAVFPVPTSP